jgi:drug/metabolite transporter (DMT)-like permease
VATVLDTGGTGLPWPRTLAEWLALAGGFSFALTNVLLRRLDFVTSGSRVLAMFGGGMVLAGGVALAGVMQGKSRRCRRWTRAAGCWPCCWRRASWPPTSRCSTAPRGCRRTPRPW